jgi:predicted N-acetyltransferase YhbS
VLKITTRPAEPGDARIFVDVAARAFADAPAHARPKDRPEFVAHTHGAANPAGRAWVTLAEDDGRFVGHVSAIPFRFCRRDGSTITGRQIGCYVVDGSQQGKGVGHAMLQDLQRALSGPDVGGFVYTYPNPRSIGRFLKLGGREVARASTRIVLPARLTSHGPPVDFVDPATALAVLDDMSDGPPKTGAFVRDKSYFRWRFLAEPAASRYRFAAARSGTDDFLLALAEHTALGRRFTILVDGYPDLAGDRLGEAVYIARAAGGGRAVYLTTSPRWDRGPFSIGVPRRFDPRPVVGILMPGREDMVAELAAAPIRTGDWMGF